MVVWERDTVKTQMLQFWKKTPFTNLSENLSQLSLILKRYLEGAWWGDDNPRELHLLKPISISVLWLQLKVQVVWLYGISSLQLLTEILD